MTLRSVLFGTTLLVQSSFGLQAESSIKITDLPIAVQNTIQDQTKDAKLRSVSKEVEHGKTLYEVETLRNGKTRDLILNPAGAVVEVEEETALADLPPAARAAIENKAQGGKITKVEALIKGTTTTYEAAITKGGKKSEFAVTAAGGRVR